MARDLHSRHDGHPPPCPSRSWKARKASITLVIAFASETALGRASALATARSRCLPAPDDWFATEGNASGDRL